MYDIDIGLSIEVWGLGIRFYQAENLRVERLLGFDIGFDTSINLR